MRKICIYHSRDLDGRCSAAIVRRKHPDVELYPYDYGEAIDLEQFRDALVFMVDIALQPFDRMITLAKLCDLHWIDHHKTAIEAYEQTTSRILGRRRVGLAGCELTWAELFPDLPAPRAVTLLGRYDVWDRSDEELWDEMILPFQYGLRAIDSSPSSTIWQELLSSSASCDGWIADGETILNYELQQHAELCRADAFFVVFDGLRAVCMNRRSCGSQLFESRWNHAEFDAMLSFGYDGKKWTVSLYTDKPGIDVGEVARRRGGGGHKQAAGFQVERLPEELGGDRP